MVGQMMTDAELTILSLVAEEPRFGHEIQQIIDERGLREWLTIGFSSVYYILNKLENQNMVSSTLRNELRGPARKLYAITEPGQGILQTAVANLLSQPRGLGTGFELGLANIQALKPHHVYREISHHRDELEYQLQLVQQSWDRHQNDDSNNIAEHIRALYTHSISLMTAELEWMNQFISDWKVRYPNMDNPSKQRTDEFAKASVTRVGATTTVNRAKMLQRLKRPPKQE